MFLILQDLKKDLKNHLYNVMKQIQCPEKDLAADELMMLPNELKFRIFVICKFFPLSPSNNFPHGNVNMVSQLFCRDRRCPKRPALCVHSCFREFRNKLGGKRKTLQ